MNDQRPHLILGADPMNDGDQARIAWIGTVRRRVERLLGDLYLLDPMEATASGRRAVGVDRPASVSWRLGDGILIHSSPRQIEGTFETTLTFGLPGGRTRLMIDHAYDVPIVPDGGDVRSMRSLLLLVLLCLGPDDTMITDRMPDRLGAEWRLFAMHMADEFGRQKRWNSREAITARAIRVESETPLGHGAVESVWSDPSRIPTGAGGMLPGRKAPGCVVGVTVSGRDDTRDADIDLRLQVAGMTVPCMDVMDRLREEARLRDILGDEGKAA